MIVLIHCETCGVDIKNPRGGQRFCKLCAKERRREKFKLYNKKRREKDAAKANEMSRVAKARLRSERKEQNLCMDCGGPKERDIIRCNKCNETFKRRNIKRYRKMGMEPAGKSKYQELTLSIVKSLTNHEVKTNDRSTIYNPETNYGLELDIYLPSLKLAFEVDGPMHREPIYGVERFEMQIKNDQITDKQCIKNGIELVRISTDDIDNHGEEWLRKTLSQAIRMASK